MVSPNEAPRPKLVLPELPTPYPGVFAGVSRDFSSDPEGFSITVERKVKNENPKLWNLLRNMLIINPNPTLDVSLREHSKRWTLTYYELFSRSARQSGLPMLEVTKDTIDTFGKLKIFDLLTNAYNRLEEYYNEEWNEWIKKITDDEEENGELKSFWANVKEEIALLKENGYCDLPLRDTILPIIYLHDLLRKQHGEYRLYERYIPK